MSDVEKGLYKSKKSGRLFFVDRIAKHGQDCSQTMIVYRNLQDTDDKPADTEWVVSESVFIRTMIKCDIEPISTKPKLFDLVKVWNDDRNDFVVGYYNSGLKNGSHHVFITYLKTELYKHAVKIPHEMAEQLKKLDEVAV